jgi:hypothetical protein
VVRRVKALIPFFLLRALNWEHTAALGDVDHLVDRIRRFVGSS